MLPIDEILEALDLSRAEPGIGFLEALVDRFNARIPFETASKILRHRQVGDADSRLRRPELFWKEHLERGAGGTCFARVAAFEALLVKLGFPARRVLGRVQHDFDHAALWVTDRERAWLCDVGFPLPTLVPAAEGEIDTGLGALAVTKTERGFRVQLREGIPDGPRTLEIFATPVSDEEFERSWQATFRSDSRFLSAVALRRQSMGKATSFARGEIRVDDRHTRLAVPLAEGRSRRLAEIFEIDQELLEDALALAGDPPPPRRDARLTAYFESAASPSEAFAAIASAAAYRKLLEGVAAIESEDVTENAWRFVLRPPSGADSTSGSTLTEEALPDLDRRELRVRRLSSSGMRESLFRAEEHEGRTYLVGEVTLVGPREDLLGNDSRRGRLAGALAVDLIAWARLLG